MFVEPRKPHSLVAQWDHGGLQYGQKVATGFNEFPEHVDRAVLKQWSTLLDLLPRDFSSPRHLNS